MKLPSSPGADHGPLYHYADDGEAMLVPHITVTQNNAGEKIAKSVVNGKVYEARHPYDGMRAAEALGAEIARLNREGKLASGLR